MLNQFLMHCIIRLTFEAYVDSLNVLEVCGKYTFENQYVEGSGLTLLFAKWEVVFCRDILKPWY